MVENTEQFTPSRKWMDIEADNRLDDDAIFEVMLDSPTTRRHLIVPGIWHGNQTAAGGIALVKERTPEALA